MQPPHFILGNLLLKVKKLLTVMGVAKSFDKNSYLKSVETLLKDSSNFKNIPVVPHKDLNYLINSEKRTTFH